MSACSIADQWQSDGHVARTSMVARVSLFIKLASLANCEISALEASRMVCMSSLMTQKQLIWLAAAKNCSGTSATRHARRTPWFVSGPRRSTVVIITAIRVSSSVTTSIQTPSNSLDLKDPLRGVPGFRGKPGYIISVIQRCSIM